MRAYRARGRHELHRLHPRRQGAPQSAAPSWLISSIELGLDPAVPAQAIRADLLRQNYFLWPETPRRRDHRRKADRPVTSWA
jgi:hypothetical protein